MALKPTPNGATMRITTAAASLLGCTILLGSSAHAQAARHYDCSKAGNANKAVCKNAAAAASPAAPVPAATASAPAKPSKTERHYDCTKAGNANKTVCKGAAPAAAPASAAAAPATKPSIFDRLRARKATPATSATASAAPQASPAAAPSGAYKGKSITTDPAGATGQCKDGSYTHATHHSGACSSHGGVAKWMNG